MQLHSVFDSIDFHNGGATFREIFDKHYKAQYYYARKLLKNDTDAEDIAIDSFRKLWDGRTGFTEEHSIRKFLYVTTYHACLNFLRDKKHTTDISLLEQEINTGHHYIRAEVMDDIRRQIENLPPACRNVFHLRFYEGLSRAEVAEALDISPSTVDSHTQKALQQLKKVLSDKTMQLLLLYLFARDN